MVIDIPSSPCMAFKNQQNVADLCFLCLFFWLFGWKSILLHWFCNMLIINTYFDSCNIDATSGANALIVNESLF